MIKSNTAKHRPFKTVEVPSHYFIREAQVFSELFPDKNHRSYGLNEDVQISLFSDFEKKIALLMYPDWKNIIIYMNKQIKSKEGKQIINIYLFDKDAIESFQPHETISGLKDITLNKEYIFTDEQLGKNKGSLVIFKNGELHLFQNNREKNECIEALEDPVVLDNIRYYKVGEKYLMDVPDLIFHSSKDYVEHFKKQPANIFKSEDDLYYLTNYYNVANNIKDDPSKYHSVALFDVKDSGEMSQSYYFINKDSDCFECNFRYPVIIDYEINAWIVKKTVEVGLLKSEVLFLFESDKDILDLPIKE